MHEPLIINGIQQLTDDLPIVTQGDGDHYIGYDDIGESYSGNRKYALAERDALFAAEIAKQTGDGICLDLGCGDGCLTVPMAQFGVRVIAGDISNNMIQILQRRAEKNNISLDTVMLCRMNALHIPLAGGSVRSAVCNSVLHLISRPEKVISEIHRVLEPGGAFICRDDLPGRIDVTKQNLEYRQIADFLFSHYWQYLNERGITPKRYSWKYDRDAICAPLFSSKEEFILPYQKESSITFAEGFLARFSGRGFSDQVDVPPALHNAALEDTLEVVCQSFGNGFGDVETYWAEGDLKITIYRK
ncbi:MAG: class I SAM-dependent methyltransferase [Oscillospiraceae bacterium]|nr:class I SAM-dependent methyltransferase [Oscillospiraceae bacterium]